MERQELPEHTPGGFFPPYFVEVSLAWALIAMPVACAATAWRQAVAAQEAEAATTRVAEASVDWMPDASVLPDDAEECDEIASQAIEQGVRSAALAVLAEQAPREQVVTFALLRHDVVVSGTSLPEDVLRTQLARFVDAVATWESQGGRLAAFIGDLGNGDSLTYAADEPFYSASSIKGPYVISLYQSLAEQGQVADDELAKLAEPTIVESDNDAYRELRNRYGGDVFADWAVACGAVRPGGKEYARFRDHHYLSITARQLARLWEGAFAFFDDESDAARQLAELFEQREESPLRAGTPSADLTIAKAGWYPEDDGEKYATTVDAGIVMQDGHSYVVVVMTDMPADLNALALLVPGLFDGRKVLL